MDLSKFISRRVQRSVVEVHVAHGRSESLIGLWLDFGEGGSVMLGCDQDGQSLQVSSSEMPRDYDMGQYGRVEVRDGALAGGSTIEKAIPIVDDDHIMFGVLLLVDHGEHFVFNWGDDLYVQDALPPHVWDSCVNKAELPLRQRRCRR